jgi:excisionase family DNA binding protein
MDSCAQCAARHARVMAKSNWRRACRQADSAIERGLISIEEAADILSVSKATIRRFIRMGRLKGYKLPRLRSHYVRRGSLASF